MSQAEPVRPEQARPRDGLPEDILPEGVDAGWEVRTVPLPVQTTDLAAPNLGGALLRATWLSIILGLAMEGLLLILTLGSGAFSAFQPFMADLVQKVTWSVFVCVGLAFGRVISRASLPLTGLSGLLAAPTAFLLARTLHRAAASALAVSGAAPGLSPALLALIKAVEYGFLGITVAWLARRQAGITAYLAAGFATAAIFGTSVVSLTAASAGQPLTALQMVSLSVNELIFPVGCALVLFAIDLLVRRAMLAARAG